MRMTRSRIASTRVPLGLLLAAVLQAHAADVLHVPFETGLTAVKSIVEPAGDYESLTIIGRIEPQGAYRVTLSGELPASDGSKPEKVRIERAVSSEDRAGARKLRPYFHDTDPLSFPGTAPMFSRTLLEELRRTGRTHLVYQEIQPGVFGDTVDELAGEVVRIENTTVSLLVNGRLATLPVIRCRGRLQGDDTEQAEFTVLDEPDVPLMLDFRVGDTTHVSVLRLEYPQPPEAADSMENSLEKNESAPVYSLYFEFARADLREESEPTLRRIAALLGAHPDWKLSITGNTDNIGGEAANLKLSASRAAAVKEALVGRYHIAAARLATSGLGDHAPLEKNDTPEHRARNRRVELRRG
jgi:outer membrane protein OmpA-like peptidoglycan-associated protein